ncbi:PepSY domain-containing protein [Solilutibacter silvestris]|uniref:YPEB domain-containing protein n=1 Tax=Solilutibacter silvestris TaxID=1645665 RepID=A0A2K1PXV0_9GAMM|nr:PepSY domain-containing protein [Lysobacter silvestris]PNS07618.1 YPEB domain-containing protein [Lysobacter silvestris]
MNTRSKMLFFAVAAVAFSGHAAIAGELALKGAELAPQAKVKLTTARALALKARPGSISEQELEKENGGLRYSFVIHSKGKRYEVGVDAGSGKIVENARESAKQDAAEDKAK